MRLPMMHTKAVMTCSKEWGYGKYETKISSEVKSKTVRIDWAEFNKLE